MSSLPDAYAPAEVAARVRDTGVTKARMGVITMFTLAILAGAFIAFGSMFATVVTTGNDLGFGVNRLIGGEKFSALFRAPLGRLRS